MGKTSADSEMGIKWREGKLTDSDFADDISVLSENRDDVQELRFAHDSNICRWQVGRNLVVSPV